MIDKLFKYVEHEYNNAIRLLEMDTDWMTPFSIINQTSNRAFGAVSYFCLINPQLEDDVGEIWEVWRKKFDGLFHRN